MNLRIRAVRVTFPFLTIRPDQSGEHGVDKPYVSRQQLCLGCGSWYEWAGIYPQLIAVLPVGLCESCFCDLNLDSPAEFIHAYVAEQLRTAVESAEMLDLWSDLTFGLPITTRAPNAVLGQEV